MRYVSNVVALRRVFPQVLNGSPLSVMFFTDVLYSQPLVYCGLRVTLNKHLNLRCDSVKIDVVCPTRRSVDVRRHSLELLSQFAKTFKVLF